MERKDQHLNQRSMACGLLVSLFLQSCGVNVPVRGQEVNNSPTPNAEGSALHPTVSAHDQYPDLENTPPPGQAPTPAERPLKLPTQKKVTGKEDPASFVGKRLARQFLSGDKKAVIAFLKSHMYTSRYRRTFAFMSGEIVTGMLDEVSSTASGDAKMVPIQALLQLVAELPEEILGLQYLMLQLRILNEWLLMAADSVEKIETLSALEAKFHLEKNLITWFNKGLHQYRQYDDKYALKIHTTLMTFLAEASGVTNHYSHTLLFPILNALQDSGADVRIAALQALPNLLYQDTTIQELLPHILNALQDSGAGVRIAALEALPTLLGQGATVQELLPYILNALKDSDEAVRTAARETLPTLLAQGTVVQELLPPILNALQDSDAYVCIV
ncbi:MAG: HEAT repeat domain-containing protein, partial [Bacteroidota bacterium]